MLISPPRVRTDSQEKPKSKEEAYTLTLPDVHPHIHARMHPLQRAPMRPKFSRLPVFSSFWNVWSLTCMWRYQLRKAENGNHSQNFSFFRNIVEWLNTNSVDLSPPVLLIFNLLSSFYNSPPVWIIKHMLTCRKFPHAHTPAHMHIHTNTKIQILSFLITNHHLW